MSRCFGNLFNPLYGRITESLTAAIRSIMGGSAEYTAFDTWPVIPVIDDGYPVTDLIRTYF